MTIRPIRILLAAAALAGSVALAACDQEGNDGLKTPDAGGADHMERHDRPGNQPGGDIDRPGGPMRGEHGEHGAPAGEAGRPPDNTAHNKDQAAGAGVTPFDQSEKPEDIKTTAAIRKAVLAAPGMSINADNVKIITADGVVAVRGVVESQSEIDAITRIVTETEGVKSSDIQLTIDPN